MGLGSNPFYLVIGRYWTQVWTESRGRRDPDGGLPRPTPVPPRAHRWGFAHKGGSHPTHRRLPVIDWRLGPLRYGSERLYADRFTTTEQDANGQDIEKAIPFFKAFTVFNVEQIDGLPDRYRAAAPKVDERIALVESTEAFFAATGATVRHAGDQAYRVRPAAAARTSTVRVAVYCCTPGGASYDTLCHFDLVPIEVSSRSRPDGSGGAADRSSAGSAG
jgi:hypothetical protein